MFGCKEKKQIAIVIAVVSIDSYIQEIGKCQVIQGVISVGGFEPLIHDNRCRFFIGCYNEFRNSPDLIALKQIADHGFRHFGDPIVQNQIECCAVHCFVGWSARSGTGDKLRHFD